MSQPMPQKVGIVKTLLLAAVFIAFLSSALNTILYPDMAQNLTNLVFRPLVEGLIYATAALGASWVARAIKL